MYKENNDRQSVILPNDNDNRLGENENGFNKKKLYHQIQPL